MYVIPVIIFCCRILTSYGWRPYEIKITNQSMYSLDNNIFVNSTLYSNGCLDVNLEILKVLPEIFVASEVYFDSGLGKFEMELLNRTVNMCRIFREPRYEPLLQIVYKIILQYGNFPKRCPIQKQKYYIKQLSVNTELLPPIFPEKKGFFQVKFLNKSYNIFGGFSMYFVIEKKYQPKN